MLAGLKAVSPASLAPDVLLLRGQASASQTDQKVQVQKGTVLVTDPVEDRAQQLHATSLALSKCARALLQACCPKQRMTDCCLAQ